MKRLFLFIMFLFVSDLISAQVVRTPHVFFAPEFTEKAEAMPELFSWISILHVLNQEEVPDFGHDWITGAHLSLFSSPFIAVTGLSEETFHFAAPPEPLSRWIFFPRSVISDLRLACFFKLSPVLFSVSYQHDCRHEVDRSIRRQLIHDSVYFMMRPEDDICLLSTEKISADINAAAEFRLVLPAIFQDIAYNPDEGHAAVFVRTRGFTKTKPGLTAVLNGSATLSRRKDDINIGGLEPWGFDWAIQAGLGLAGSAGDAVFYLGTDRITDTGVDFDEEAVKVHYIALEFSASGK